MQPIRNLIPIALFLAAPVFVLGQKKPLTCFAAFGNNAISMPAIKFSPLHPAFQLGVEKVWKEKKFSLVQNFRAGYFYQRLVHHGIPLYTEIGCRYIFKQKLSIAAYFDAGYLHTFSDIPVFKLENGEYKRTARAGAAHAMLGYSLTASYKLKGKAGITPFIQHQFWMITPFVKTYVPLLPNSTFYAGAYFTINR